MKMDKPNNTRQYRTIRNTASNALLRASAIVMVVLCAAAFVCGTAGAVDIYVPDGGTTQQAVNNANEGDVIIVREGTYNENVNVDVANLTIRLQNGSAVTTVNAADSGDHVFDVQRDYVNISGFTVEDATGDDKAGIYLNGRQHCNISDNIASNNYYGIWLDSSSNNTLTNNTANSNIVNGIWLDSSSNNTLTNNTASDNTASDDDHSGINLCSSSNNTLTSNTANSNSQRGIYLDNADNNNVSCNWVQNNTDAGFYLTDGSTGNTIERNNIIANGALQGDGSYQWQFNNAQPDEVSTAGNWWGTDNTTRINASITGTGNVTTAPKLDGPAPCAPYPTPIYPPGYKSVPVLTPHGMILLIGLLMLAGYVRVGRRKT